MDNSTVSMLMLIANVLLFLATGGLFVAAVVYAIAARKMNRIVKWQTYIYAKQAENAGENFTAQERIRKAVEPFVKKIEEDPEKSLKGIFD